MTADQANEQLDAALMVRVDAHERKRISADPSTGGLTVHEYLTALRWVREVEAECEPARRAAGYTCSRAMETCTARTDYIR